MKKILIFFLMTFTFSQILFSQENSWTEWKETDCYKGIQFRAKKGKAFNAFGIEKIEWHLEFKNNYKDTLTFSLDAYSSENPYAQNKDRRLKYNSGPMQNGDIFKQTVRIKSKGEITIYVGKLFLKGKFKIHPCDN